MPNHDEKRLIYQVVVLHQREAFDALYLCYVSAISKFIFFRVANKDDADDLTADVFWKMWQYLTQEKKEVKKIQHFRALLYRIARNTVINFYRSQGKIPNLVELDKPGEYGDYKDLEDTRVDVFKTQLKAQDVDDLIEAVQKLSEPHKEVLALRFFEELEIEEIAEVLEKKPGHVRVLIHRGIKELQKLMVNQ